MFASVRRSGAAATTNEVPRRLFAAADFKILFMPSTCFAQKAPTYLPNPLSYPSQIHARHNCARSYAAHFTNCERGTQWIDRTATRRGGRLLQRRDGPPLPVCTTVEMMMTAAVQRIHHILAPPPPTPRGADRFPTTRFELTHPTTTVHRRRCQRPGRPTVPTHRRPPPPNFRRQEATSKLTVTWKLGPSPIPTPTPARPQPPSSP